MEAKTRPASEARPLAAPPVFVLVPPAESAPEPELEPEPEPELPLPLLPLPPLLPLLPLPLGVPPPLLLLPPGVLLPPELPLPVPPDGLDGHALAMTDTDTTMKI